ncbi:MAG TPA: peptidoglycan-associated lipoprotein Pal [Polyangia bacterium]|jgi:peptidoglycan-associated lipoprotein
MLRPVTVLPILAVLAALVGCSHAQTAKRTPEGPSLALPAPAPQKPAQAPAPEPAKPAPVEAAPGDTTVFFGYNSAVLESAARPVLQQIARALKQNPQSQVRIEGNCDERGTDEYNLALGAHRAESARRYLQALGVSPKRIKTVSYGKERPKDPGHDESAWAKNRRDEVVIH